MAAIICRERRVCDWQTEPGSVCVCVCVNGRGCECVMSVCVYACFKGVYMYVLHACECNVHACTCIRVSKCAKVYTV